ncbi:MAG TPA: DUF2934 domain-containing protein [Acetobacteraceae bacterium]|jgi:hypothetical protein|nr:DUF2934 domain-containing protein [Acetobacteraceae bacterium]
MPDTPLLNTPARHDRIRQRAYLLWEADGRPHGRDQEYWQRAEALISLEHPAAAGQLPNPQTKPVSVPGAKVETAKTPDSREESPDRSTEQTVRRPAPKGRARARKGKATPT